MEGMNELRARLEESGPRDQLPAFSDVVQRFSLFSSSSLCNTQIGQGGSLYCNCEGCCQWHAFVQGRIQYCKEVQYEVFTFEHVKGLAQYLLYCHGEVRRKGSPRGRIRAARYKLQQMNVLEVGAGSGRLCHHLNCFLSQSSFSAQGCVVQLTAADSGERGLNGPNVAKLDAIKAISEAMPHVVLVSWMPVGVDWTAHMRATPSVLEYILIGEIPVFDDSLETVFGGMDQGGYVFCSEETLLPADFRNVPPWDDGICGDPWLTWGYTGADSSSDSSSEGPTSLGVSGDQMQTKCFLHNGPGISMGTRKISDQSCSQTASPSMASCSLSGVGCDDRVEEMSSGTARNYKRLKPSPGSTEQSSVWENQGAAMPTATSAVCPSRIDDVHETTGLQISSETGGKARSDMPPYAAHGWVRTELASLSSVQICRTDERWSTLQHSHTVSFRRFIPNVSRGGVSCDDEAATDAKSFEADQVWAPPGTVYPSSNRNALELDSV